jgi:hypothetical protein
MNFKRGDVVSHTYGRPKEKYIFWANRAGSRSLCWLIPFTENACEEENEFKMYTILKLQSAEKRCLYKKSWREAKDFPTNFVHAKENE